MAAAAECAEAAVEKFTAYISKNFPDISHEEKVEKANVWIEGFLDGGRYMLDTIKNKRAEHNDLKFLLTMDGM